MAEFYGQVRQQTNYLKTKNQVTEHNAGNQYITNTETENQEEESVIKHLGSLIDQLETKTNTQPLQPSSQPLQPSTQPPVLHSASDQLDNNKPLVAQTDSVSSAIDHLDSLVEHTGTSAIGE